MATAKKKTAAKKGPLPDPRPPTASVREVVTFLPAHKHGASMEECLGMLRGKANNPEVKALLGMIQWSREDAINDCVHPSLSERESGFYAGAVSALREMERMIQEATNRER